MSFHRRLWKTFFSRWSSLTYPQLVVLLLLRFSPIIWNWCLAVIDLCVFEPTKCKQLLYGCCIWKFLRMKTWVELMTVENLILNLFIYWTYEYKPNIFPFCVEVLFYLRFGWHEQRLTSTKTLEDIKFMIIKFFSYQLT